MPIAMIATSQSSRFTQRRFAAAGNADQRDNAQAGSRGNRGGHLPHTEPVRTGVTFNELEFQHAVRDNTISHTLQI